MSKRVRFIEGGGRTTRVETDRDAAGQVVSARISFLVEQDAVDLNAQEAAQLVELLCPDDAKGTA